jgi:ketosteroid isomerase-like protein
MAVRSVGLVVAAAGAGLVFAAQPALAQAPPGAESPRAVLDRFAATFASRDADAAAALSAPDATFFGSTFHGAAEAGPLRGPEGARAYFARVFAPGGPRLAMACREEAMREPAPGLALAAAVCRVDVAQPDGSTLQRVLRVSAALTRGETGWRFADLHVSASPPAPQPR